jgi:hypothetical protein
MTDPQGFLSRWSERKLRKEPDEEECSGSAEPAEEGRGEAGTRSAGAPDAGSADAEPPFDLASLPPIESISAGTDIRGFLRPGVPAALKGAALRRTWTADPVIRDFVGLSENSWDFNAPDSIPGFGTQVTESARRAVLDWMSGSAPADAQPDVPDATAAGGPAEPKPIASAHDQLCAEGPSEPVVTAAQQMDVPERERATSADEENMITDVKNSSVKKAGHGGALPQ